MKTVGSLSAVTMAGFAGCAGDGGDGSGDGGSDGSSDGGSDGSSDGGSDGSSDGGSDGSGGSDETETAVGEDTVEMGDFEVPSDHVVPKSELSDAQAFSLEVLVPPPKNTPQEYDTISFWADSTSELGVEVSLETLPASTQIEQVWYTGREPGDNGMAGWWQVTSWSFGPRPSRLDPDEMLYNVHHSSRQSGYNFHFWEDQEYDNVVEQQRQAIDKDERQQLVYDCQKILHERGPDLVYMFPTALAPWNSNKWEGVVNINGLGPRNLVTFSNMTPKTDDTELISISTQSDELQYMTAFASAGSMDMRQTRMMYDRLMWPNEEGLASPRLATEINYQDDTTIEVPIREGHEFWDGTELLAEDVKFTYDLQRNEFDTNFTGSVEVFEDIEVADDHRLIFNLENPFSPIEVFTFARVGIESKQHWEEILESDHFQNSSQQNPGFYNPADKFSEFGGYLGSGPMKFDYWNRGEEVRLSAYENHFDPIDYDGRIDRWVPSVDTGIAQLENGEADIISWYTGDPTVLQDVVNNNDNLSMKTATNVAPQFIVFNNDFPPNHIDGFRRALSHRLDKQTIVNDIWNGWGEVPREHLVTPGLEFWWNDNLEAHEFSLQAAANRLVDAGFVWDEEENRVHMPADNTSLSEEDIAPANDAGFSRDPATE